MSVDTKCSTFVFVKLSKKFWDLTTVADFSNIFHNINKYQENDAIEDIFVRIWQQCQMVEGNYAPKSDFRVALLFILTPDLGCDTISPCLKE